MDLINAEYDRKIWANDEMIQSDEQRADKEYEIEMARWEALRENFEAQKKMKEAQAWMDFASGSVGIWTAPGITSLAPYGYILAGIQQAALLATLFTWLVTAAGAATVYFFKNTPKKVMDGMLGK